MSRARNAPSSVIGNRLLRRVEWPGTVVFDPEYCFKILTPPANGIVKRKHKEPNKSRHDRVIVRAPVTAHEKRTSRTRLGSLPRRNGMRHRRDTVINRARLSTETRRPVRRPRVGVRPFGSRVRFGRNRRVLNGPNADLTRPERSTQSRRPRSTVT